MMNSKTTTARRRLTNREWRSISRILRKLPGVYIGNGQKTRRFVEGIFWMARMGAPWRELPERYGKWNSVYRRFARWGEGNVWQKMFEHSVDNPDMEWLILDGTIIRAHACAAGAPVARGGQSAQALGKSRGGFTCKIHIVVDALGNPLDFVLTPGQKHEVKQAPQLLAGHHCDYVIGDKAYDADDLLDLIENMGATPVIPPRKGRKNPQVYDKHLYKERHLIECFINKIKWFRRIFSRFDKLDVRYLDFLFFVSTLIWVR